MLFVQWESFQYANASMALFSFLSMARCFMRKNIFLCTSFMERTTQTRATSTKLVSLAEFCHLRHSYLGKNLTRWWWVYAN